MCAPPPLRPPLLSKWLLLILSIIIALSPSAHCACPPVFFAQAISARQIRSIEFYLTRTSVPSAAECADICAQQSATCRMAVFNHDAKMCALASGPVLVDCRATKHRFNTFHLTTDGADAISLLSCIEPCRRTEKEADEEGFSHLLNIDLGPPPQFSTTRRAPQQLLDGNGLDPIVPINAATPFSNKQQHQSHQSAVIVRGQASDAGQFPMPELLSLHEGPVQNKEQKETLPAGKGGREGGDGGFLSAVQRLHEIQKRLEQILRETQRKRQGARGNVEEGKPQKKVHFRAGGMRLDGEEEERPKGRDASLLLHSNYSVGGNSSGSSAEQSHMFVRTFNNGTEERVHSAGFIKLLRPGERIKLVTPRQRNGSSGVELIQLVEPEHTLAIPAQLVTMTPELFERGGAGAADTAVPPAPPRSPPPTDSPSSSPSSSTPSPPPDPAQFSHQDVTRFKEFEADSNQIVVNHRLLSAEEAALLLAREQKASTSSTTTTTRWSPAGLIGQTFGALRDTSSEQEAERQERIKDGETSFAKVVTVRKEPEKKNSIVCFRFIQQQQLQHTAFATLRGVSLNECRCACANSWRGAEERQQQQCKSVQYNEREQECRLNGADHNGKQDLVLARGSDYHYVSCDVKYLLKTAEKMCKVTKGKRDEREKENANTTTTAQTTTPTTTTIEWTTTEAGTAAAAADGEPPATPSSPAPSTSTSTSTSTSPSTSSTPSPLPSSPAPEADDDCFERIAGFSMGGTAAGLERGVSLAECECLCANSLVSRMYSFQCTSASYYHADRDCVLNLDSRHSSPELFTRSNSELDRSEITYLGLLCSPEKAVLRLVNGSLMSHSGCTGAASTNERERESTTPADGSTARENRIEAKQTDECFLEQPNFVLEGLALAVETNVTVGQCKCFCADAERRYGSECQSLQYYYDSHTCLLNRENRLSEPEHFNFDANSAARHSYFDYRCGAEKSVAANYSGRNCELEAKSGDVEVTTPQLRILKKAKRRKGKRGGKPKVEKEEVMRATEVGTMETETAGTREQTSTSTTTTTTTVVTRGQRKEEEAEPEDDGMETRKVVLEGPAIPEAEDDAEQRGWRTVPVLGGDDVPVQQQHRAEVASSSSPAPTPPPSTTGPTTTTTAPPQSTATTPSSNTTTTTSTTTTTTFEYPPAGPCRFSALYQTVFNGARVLKRLLVDTPAQCLAACHFEGCRSANLIQMEDKQKVCELFRDSIVEFRRNDVLSFDRLAVHFDSIQCQG